MLQKTWWYCVSPLNKNNFLSFFLSSLHNKSIEGDFGVGVQVRYVSLQRELKSHASIVLWKLLVSLSNFFTVWGP